LGKHKDTDSQPKKNKTIRKQITTKKHPKLPQQKKKIRKEKQIDKINNKQQRTN